MRQTIKRHVEGKSRSKAIAHLGQQIYEFRVNESGIWLRVLFFTDNPHIVGVKTVMKKQNKADVNDINYAIRSKTGWVPKNCQGAVDLSWW
jgi:phage-related protein